MCSFVFAFARPQVLGILWYVAYFFCFAAMFTTLPMHAEYLNRGERFWWQRAYQAIRVNLLFYAVCVVIGVVGFAALIIQGTLDLEGIVGFATGASNAFGLFLSLFLMGYGLVEIPKKAWRSANYAMRERLATHLVGVRAEELVKMHTELVTCVLITRHLKTYMRHGPGADHLLEVSDEAERDIEECGLSDAASRAMAMNDSYDDEDYDDDVGMARLHKRLKAARVAYSRALVRLPRAVKRALDMADRRAGQANGSWGARYECTLPRAGRCSPDWCRQLEWAWKCRLQPVCARLGALALALLSATVVYSQVTLAAGCAQPNFSLFSAIVHYNQECDKPVWTPLLDALVLLPLTYICLSTLYGLFKVQIFSTYVLTKGASDGYSMLTCALLMCRLSSPIAYNFLRITCVDDGRCARFFEDACSAALTDDACAAAGTIEGQPGTVCTWDAANQTQPCFLPQNVADSWQTVFYENIGQQIDKAPLVGKDLNQYVPALLLLHVFLLVIGLYDRLCGICSPTQRFRFSHEDDAHEDRFMVQGRHTLREVRANLAEGAPWLAGLAGTGTAGGAAGAGMAGSGAGTPQATRPPPAQPSMSPARVDRHGSGGTGRSWQETKDRLASAAGRATAGERVDYKHARRGSSSGAGGGGGYVQMSPRGDVAGRSSAGGSGAAGVAAVTKSGRALDRLFGGPAGSSGRSPGR